MWTHASCATCRSSWRKKNCKSAILAAEISNDWRRRSPPYNFRRLTLAGCPEKNGHGKRDDCSETNPPREFHHRQPARLWVKLCAEDAGDRVGQSAEDSDDDEADDHGKNVAEIITAPFREHAAQKYAEKRAVSVPENAEHDRDDPHFRV